MNSPWINYLAGGCVASSMGAATTFVPLYMKSLGASYFMSGLPLGVRAIGRFTFDAAAMVVAGRRITPETMLVLGVSFAGIALLACGVFPDSHPVTAAFFFIGAGVAWVQVALRQIVFDGAESGRRGRALGVLSIFLGSGPMIGIFFGGVISEYFGYPSMFVVAALIVLWLPLLLVRLSPDRAQSEGEKDPLRLQVIREILSTPGARIFCASSFFTLFYQPARSLALAFYATGPLGLSVSSYGLVRSISQLGNVNGRFFGGLWTDRSGVMGCLVTGYLISAAGYVLVPWTNGFWSLLIVHTAVGAGAGMVNLASQVGILSIFDSTKRGQALALQRTVGDVGLFLGPMIVSAGLDAYGFFSVFMGLATPALALGLWTILGSSLRGLPVGNDDGVSS